MLAIEKAGGLIKKENSKLHREKKNKQADNQLTTLAGTTIQLPDKNS